MCIFIFRDKFEVTPQSVPYLAALVSVSEEVRSRCHLKHRNPPTIPESASSDSISVDLAQHQQPVTPPAPPPVAPPPQPPPPPQQQAPPPQQQTTPTTRRQKSWDLLDQNAMAQARLQKQGHMTQVQVSTEV